MNKSDLLTEIAAFCGKSQLLRKLFRAKYKAKRQKEAKWRIENFHKHGLEALDAFNSCMNEHHYSYSLAFGTMLGAIREGDFIPHDDDLDFAMWINDYDDNLINHLKSYGFKLKHSFSINDDSIGKEDTFEFKGVLLDIFYFYKETTGKSYCCDFINQPDCHSRLSSIRKHGGLLPRKIYVPLGNDTIDIDFKGIKVKVPRNYHEILTCRYGSDYMTPKPDWKPETDSVIPQPNLLGIYKEY